MINGHRMGAFNESIDGGMFSGQSQNPVVTVDGPTGSPTGFHRNSAARPPLPWEREQSLRDRLVDSITADDQSGAPLLLELDSLERKIQAFLRGKQAEKTLDLKAELAEVNARGKLAVEKAVAAAEAGNVARGAYNAYLEEAAKAQRELKRAKAEAPTEDDFADDFEIAEHAERLAMIQTGANRIMQESKRLHAVMKLAEAAAREAKRDVDAIRHRRDELRALLGGGKRRSPVASLGPIGLRSE